MEKLNQTEQFRAGRREGMMPESVRGWASVLVQWIQDKVYREVAKRVNHLLGYDGSKTWDPGSVADGDEAATTVTVTGAELGDYAIASFSLDVTDLILDAQVTAEDTATVVLANNTGGAINLGSGTLRVKVIPK
jgi:hypothetical protein